MKAIKVISRHFARPYAKTAMTKRKASFFMVLGGSCFLLGSIFLIGIWHELSLIDRTIFIAGLAFSLWLLPWTGANLSRQKDK